MRRRSMLLGVALAGCAAEPLERPTFQDVTTILAASCLRCHAYPPIGGAPGDCAPAPGGGDDAVRWCGFRLDSYDDFLVDEGDPGDPGDDVGVRGAAWVAAIIPSRVRDPRAPMPPRFPLEDAERETLIAWARGEPPLREPRPGNRAPAFAVDVVATAGGYTLAYELDDADGDLVVGQLRARLAGAVDHLVTPVQSGRDEVAWTPVGLPAGSYELYARVDDGGGWRDLAAGALDVGAP